MNTSSNSVIPIKLWVDDVRPAPKGFHKVSTVNEAMSFILSSHYKIELLDLDHDAGDYFDAGGDYIEILKGMEVNGINDIPIHLHTMNPVGRQNMRNIIQHNNWIEV